MRRRPDFSRSRFGGEGVAAARGLAVFLTTLTAIGAKGPVAMARGNRIVYIVRLTVCKASRRDQSRPYISTGGALLHCGQPRVRKAG